MDHNEEHKVSATFSFQRGSHLLIGFYLDVTKYALDKIQIAINIKLVRFRRVF